MRTVVISWETSPAPVVGDFTPGGYKVTFGGQTVVVAASPASIGYTGSAGTYSASIQLVDSNGVERGGPVMVDVDVPVAQTIAGVGQSLCQRGNQLMAEESFSAKVSRIWNAGSSLKKPEVVASATGVAPVDNIILRKMYSQYVLQMQEQGLPAAPYEEWRKTQGK